MRVLMPASEVSPLVKIGGLGDVVGSLPKALEKLGVDVDVIVPFYSSVKIEGVKLYKSTDLDVPFGGDTYVVETFKTKNPGSNVDVILLKNDLFQKGGRSAFSNNLSETEMFAFFDRAVVEYIKSGFNTYDLIHCNDWHTGLITHFLEDELGTDRPRTLFTIHNLLYQGKGNSALLKSLGIVPGSHPSVDWDTQDGDLNMLLQGVISSDFISTVSESYAKEILTKEYGGMLSDILLSRQARLFGIVNGIDYTSFPKAFSIKEYSVQKNEYKNLIRKRFKLEKNDSPLFCYIGRIDPNQKGMDILLEALPSLLKMGAQFVLLGTGDPVWEDKFSKIAKQYEKEGNIAVSIGFDADLANDLYRGSDFIAIPSKYEPCGLIQMIAMMYGTIPVAHAVGGLKDTVQHNINGFTFQKYSSAELLSVLKEAVLSFGNTKHASMVENCLNCSFDWDESSRKYKKLYERILEENL